MDLDFTLQANTTGFQIIKIISVKLSTDVSYAKIEDRDKNFDGEKDAGYSRFLARINDTF